MGYVETNLLVQTFLLYQNQNFYWWWRKLSPTPVMQLRRRGTDTQALAQSVKTVNAEKFPQRKKYIEYSVVVEWTYRLRRTCLLSVCRSLNHWLRRTCFNSTLFRSYVNSLAHNGDTLWSRRHFTRGNREGTCESLSLGRLYQHAQAWRVRLHRERCGWLTPQTLSHMGVHTLFPTTECT